MGRPATDSAENLGTVQPFKDAKGRTYYRARISLVDGERIWVGERFYDREKAVEYAADKSREAQKRKLTIAKVRPVKPNVETADAWHARYLESAEKKGIVTTRSKGSLWKTWISPTIGHKPMTSVTKDDVEDIRDAMDEAIQEGRIAPKYAQNAWGELAVSFSEAANAKDRTLRCITVDPTTGVKPPERGPSKSKVYPFPSEALAVFACADVALAWRELHAVACYTGMRPGELRVLEWPDVDLADGTIRVTKAWDYDHERVKPTKTGESRVIPIEPHLVPLLQLMHDRVDGKGPVVPLLSNTNDDKLAIHTRAHFVLAGCKRARLTAHNAAELQLRFRSWRDAYVTWSIIRGDDVVKVQRRAGHRLIQTTMRYAVEAENRGASFGTPFPRLPAALLLSKLPANLDPTPLQATGTDGDSQYRRRDSNPHTRKDGGF
jgi:integrase